MHATAAEREIVQVFDSLLATLTRDRDADAGARLFAADEDVVMWGSQSLAPLRRDRIGHPVG
jgi:hypothetical protein